MEVAIAALRMSDRYLPGGLSGKVRAV